MIGGIVAKGIKLTSYTQIAFTLVEAGVLALLIAIAAFRPRSRHGRFCSAGSWARA